MKDTWVFKHMTRVDSRFICMFTGNQFGKTMYAMAYLVRSILGILHYQPHNLQVWDKVRTFRLCSETLPNDEGEVRNTLYPVLKRFLPKAMIKKDITLRKPVMQLRDIAKGGPDIFIEFVSYNQDVQAQAGVQRRGIILDEHAPKAFYEEQIPRLLAADVIHPETGDMVSKGWMINTLTPAQEFLDWEYDEFFDRARRIIRTPAVCKRIYKRMGEKPKTVEDYEGKADVTVIMAATDDNPILAPQTIEDMFAAFGDEDVIDIRRYGLFKQISGRIYKNFDKTNIIESARYFPEGIPFSWVHARGIDFHQHNPWAIGWISLSPKNEAFIWGELSASPERMVTLDVAKEIVAKSKDYPYPINLIDPLANQKQSATGLSVVDDLNRYFYDMKREGFGTGGYWQTWDTKSTRGRDEIRMRLANAKTCGVPFNNRIQKDGQERYLPTLWIFDTCRQVIDSFKNWRKEEWSSRDAMLIKDPKDSPQQRWSHFPMVFEGIFKSPAFSVNRYKGTVLPHDRRRTHQDSFRRVA